MTLVRTLNASVAVTVAVTTLAFAALPSTAHADERSRVETIAAKGTISPLVPVEAGLGLGIAAALLAVGMQRRARR